MVSEALSYGSRPKTVPKDEDLALKYFQALTKAAREYSEARALIFKTDQGVVSRQDSTAILSTPSNPHNSFGFENKNIDYRKLDAILEKIESDVEKNSAKEKLKRNLRLVWTKTKPLTVLAKQKTPSLMVGALTGGSVRIGAQFLMAAFVVTTPGIIATMATAVLAGSVAGGASKFLTTCLFDKDKKKDIGWKRKAFLQGALFGALGGFIGFAVAEYLDIGSLFRGHTHSVSGNYTSISSGADASTSHAIQETSGLAYGATSEPMLVAEASTSESATNAVLMSSTNQVHDIVSLEHLKKLPRGLQKLAKSDNPRDLIVFCKEASFKLINGRNRGTEDLKTGAMLIKRGIEIAERSGLHNSITKSLYADGAYIKAWGIGTERDVDTAIAHAKQAGSAAHNYGKRLLNLFHAPANV